MLLIIRSVCAGIGRLETLFDYGRKANPSEFLLGAVVIGQLFSMMPAHFSVREDDDHLSNGYPAVTRVVMTCSKGRK